MKKMALEKFEWDRKLRTLTYHLNYDEYLKLAAERDEDFRTNGIIILGKYRNVVFWYKEKLQCDDRHGRWFWLFKTDEPGLEDLQLRFIDRSLG